MALGLDYVTPNSALATALLSYPFIFRLAAPRQSSTQRFILTREAISAAHAALISVAAASELYRRRDDWLPAGYQNGLDNATFASYLNSTVGAQPSTLIETQSTVGDAIISWECGYLLADFLILSLGAPRDKTKSDRSLLARSANWRVLGFHHLGLGCALIIYHLRAVKTPVRGVMVMLMLILMNVSTPFGTLSWYLAKFHPKHRLACASNLAYIASYAWARIFLVYWAHRMYSISTKQSLFAGYMSTPRICRLGVATVLATNTTWLIRSTRRFIRKYLQT